MDADIREDPATFIDILVELLMEEGRSEVEANEFAKTFVSVMRDAFSEKRFTDADLGIALLSVSLGRELVDCPITPTVGGMQGTVFLLVGSGLIEFDPSMGYVARDPHSSSGPCELYVREDAEIRIFECLLEKETALFSDCSIQEFRKEWYRELRERRADAYKRFGIRDVPLRPGAVPTHLRKHFKYFVQWENDYEGFESA
jgi:hypothetical protein